MHFIRNIINIGIIMALTLWLKGNPTRNPCPCTKNQAPKTKNQTIASLFSYAMWISLFSYAMYAAITGDYLARDLFFNILLYVLDSLMQKPYEFSPSEMTSLVLVYYEFDYYELEPHFWIITSFIISYLIVTKRENTLFIVILIIVIFVLPLFLDNVKRRMHIPILVAQAAKISGERAVRETGENVEWVWNELNEVWNEVWSWG
eukprot:UN00917